MWLGVFSLRSCKHLTKCGTMYNFQINSNGRPGNLLNPLRDFVSERKERVVYNGQVSTWRNVTVGVPQGSIFDSLFLVYINDLSERRSTNAKLFADDPSLFSAIHDNQTSANDFNKFRNYT